MPHRQWEPPLRVTYALPLLLHLTPLLCRGAVITPHALHPVLRGPPRREPQRHQMPVRVRELAHVVLHWIVVIVYKVARAAYRRPDVVPPLTHAHSRGSM